MSKSIKRRMSVALVFMMGLLAACGGNGGDSPEANGGAGTDSELLNIGIVQLADHVALDRAREGFEEGLAEAGFVDGENITIDFKNAQNDQSNLSTITQQFAADKKDLVCAIATQSAVSMASSSQEIPIVGTAITDYEAANLVASNDAPGGNVTGVSDLNPVDEQVALLVDIVPDAKTVGVIYTSSEENSRIQVELFKEAAAAKGLEVKEATVTNVNDIQQAATNLVGNVDAIYVPTDNTMATAITNLTGITNEAGIPVIAGEVAHLEGGALATVSIDYFDLGKQTGEMAARILSGEADPATTPVERSREYKVVVNEQAAEALDIEIPESILAKAEADQQ